MSLPDAIKVFRSTDAGAPSLIGAAGSIIGLLDAVLLNGYNSKAVQSITVADGVMTVTTTTAHGMVVGQVLAIAGANESVFNDEFVVQTVPSPVSYTCVAPVGAPAAATGGSITSKQAALNWEKQFSNTNLACYRSTDPRSIKPVLSVDNTFAYWARMRMYESMNSVSTGVGGDHSAVAGQAYGVWQSGVAAETTAKPWIVIGNSRLFYFLPAFNTASPNVRAWYGMGEFRSYKVGDAYNAMFLGNHSAILETYPGSAVAYGNFNPGATTGGSTAILRNMMGTYPSITWGSKGSINCNSAAAASGAAGSPWPNWAGNVITLFPCQLWEGLGLRGNIPGALFIPVNFGAASNIPAEQMVVSPELPGRSIALVTIQSSGNANGLNGFDVTGPWSM